MRLCTVITKVNSKLTLNNVRIGMLVRAVGSDRALIDLIAIPAILKWIRLVWC